MMREFWFSFIGMFVAMDIIGTVPIYMGMSRGVEPKKRKKVVRQSIMVAAIVALIFVLIGQQIFKVLGIAMHDFKVGGGIVLLVMAILDLIKSKRTEEHSTSTGIVPLAVPLITGPALITTVMLQAVSHGNVIVVLSMFCNFAFAWFALEKSALITKLIGDEGTDIISKIAALLMTAIAFSMIRSGIFDAIKVSL